MNQTLEKAVRRWLRLERQGAEQQSERALGAVFSALPPESVPIDFAERVLASLGHATVQRRERSVAITWSLRTAVSVSLLLVALFLLVVPSYLPALLGIFNVGRATDVGVGALVGVFQQLGVGLVVWRILSAAGSILATAMSSPPFLATLLMGALLSLGAFRVLHQVIISERSSRYVGPA